MIAASGEIREPKGPASAIPVFAGAGAAVMLNSMPVDPPTTRSHSFSAVEAVGASDILRAPPGWKWLRVFEAVAALGVPATMTATESKHVRFCNLASLVGGTCALLFFCLSLPVVTDWGNTTTLEATVIMATGLGALLFFLPLLLNFRGLHRAARTILILGLTAHLTLLSICFAAAAPSHLFFLVAATMPLALFPNRESGRMWFLVALCLTGFAGAMWLRFHDQPLIPVHRPGVRLVMDVVISAGSILTMIVITQVLRSTTNRAELMAIREQERADRLLLNILPEQIARRLKTDPGTIADGFREVTVLFADLVGFTSMSRKMSPMETLELVNEVFSRFDSLVDDFGLEKIKTIGDAYMLAGGLPTPVTTHAGDVARMALAMQQEIKSIHGPAGEALHLRIGISSGPVVAGVIGRKKFLYDLWGDTVNTASRMESSCEPDRIQVSEPAWLRLKDKFRLLDRGLVEIKGQGQARTWFLEGLTERGETG